MSNRSNSENRFQIFGALFGDHEYLRFWWWREISKLLENGRYPEKAQTLNGRLDFYSKLKI